MRLSVLPLNQRPVLATTQFSIVARFPRVLVGALNIHRPSSASVLGRCSLSEHPVSAAAQSVLSSARFSRVLLLGVCRVGRELAAGKDTAPDTVSVQTKT